MIKKIIHIDMDAFFAAVEQKDNPSYTGYPLIVGGCSNRGVVCAASYEARKYGIHSAMATQKARKLCPEGIFIAPRIERYAEISRQIMNIFYEFTDLVEPLSLDEAYLDVTHTKSCLPYASHIAKEIKNKILSKTGLTASAGVGPNKLVAKIASDYKKPNGLVVVTPDKVKEFLNPLSVRKICGIGAVTEKRLTKIGIKTIEDLAKYDVGKLEETLGKTGIFFNDLAKGIDKRGVNPIREAKSMGDETTFSEDATDAQVIITQLQTLISKLSSRMERRGVKGKTVCLKVKYSDFIIKTRRVTLWFYTRDPLIIFLAAKNLFKKTEIGIKPIRLVGISLSHLVTHQPYEQLLLIDPVKIL